ncbi:MAG TPA: ATP-binding cassette domain-containing protein, partial [Methylomirabilota bacterium]|nr:ATP-binding cassette domain-containing protein [Methylomirabilota bacterium]
MLTVDGLGVTYGGLHALDGVALEVNEGEFVTLLGPNGAGKTTLLKAISGAVPAETGRVLYRGRDLARLRPSER